MPYIWSQVEPTTAIICACITTYRPLFRGLSLRPISNLSWFSAYRTRSSSNVITHETGSTEPAWPAPPKPDHRSVVDRFQDFVFSVPSDPGGRSRTQPPSEMNGPTLGIFEEMMERPTAANAIYEDIVKKRAAAERDSGHGSAKGSVAGHWPENEFLK